MYPSTSTCFKSMTMCIDHRLSEFVSKILFAMLAVYEVVFSTSLGKIKNSDYLASNCNSE